ncbi:hypothetical protein [Paenibacillus plantiphilus]|uniref:hypothetical protein n=1 Tax=Paenibacillus plantiphilus TaxID=2905650 RepID=UPI0027D9C09E|nr:hypothetical protein [Paenibacillus plantiphilus]
MDKELISAQLKKKKMMMSPEQFARIALKGLEQNQTIVCPMPLRRTMNIFFILFLAVHRKLIRYFCK